MSKISVKELQKLYKVYSMDRGKTQILNNLNGYGEYSTQKYLAHIIKIKSGVYQVPGFEPTNSLETLIENVGAYTKSLKYNSEFYNPVYRKGYFEKMVVIDYMRKLGFEQDSAGYSTNSVCFVLKRKTIYQGNREEIHISVNGLDYWSSDDKLPETVTVTLHNGNYSWVETKPIPRNPDYIIPEIDALLKPLLIYDSVKDFTKSDELKMKDVDIIMKSLMNNLSVNSQDYKEELKKSLKGILAVLK